MFPRIQSPYRSRSRPYLLRGLLPYKRETGPSDIPPMMMDREAPTYPRTSIGDRRMIIDKRLWTAVIFDSRDG